MQEATAHATFAATHVGRHQLAHGRRKGGEDTCERPICCRMVLMSYSSIVNFWLLPGAMRCRMSLGVPNVSASMSSVATPYTNSSLHIEQHCASASEGACTSRHRLPLPLSALLA